MSDMLLQERLREFTVAEFHRMVETGIIDESERVELLDGQLIRMPPIGVRHWDRHARIVAYLNKTLHGRTKIVGQGSFPLGDRNEPQPDIAVLPVRMYELENRSPDGPEVFAFIELADSSRSTDLGPKREIYARYGIREYLVVDLEDDRLLRHRDPDGPRYRALDTLGHGDEFALVALPDVMLSATPFLSPKGTLAAEGTTP